jgi:GT2 family glycosyltransferase
MHLENLVIIVLNYNNYDLTIRNINNILKLYDNNIKFHIVIVDNKSNDNSYEIIRNYYKNYNNIYVLQSERNFGYAAGNNFGIRYIMKLVPDIKYIGIINPDSFILNKNTFTNLISKLESNDEIAAIAPVMIEDNIINLRSIAWKIPNVSQIFIESLFVISKF